MSADNILDNFITLFVFVPIGLLACFALWFFVEGLILVPYKMWKEAQAAKPIEHHPDPFGAWDWNLEQLSAYLRSRGVGGDTDYKVCNSLRERLKNGRLHIEARQGDPEQESTWSEHRVILPADWIHLFFDEASFEKSARFWRSRSNNPGFPAHVDMRVRCAQVLREWPPAVGQSIAETIQPRPRLWVRHLATEVATGGKGGFRHHWEVKIRSAFAPPSVKLALAGAGIRDLVPDVREYCIEDDGKPFEIEVTNPPPLFTFSAETVEAAAPQVLCEFVT